MPEVQCSGDRKSQSLALLWAWTLNSRAEAWTIDWCLSLQGISERGGHCAQPKFLLQLAGVPIEVTRYAEMATIKERDSGPLSKTTWVIQSLEGYYWNPFSPM